MDTDTVDETDDEVKMEAGFLGIGDVFYWSGCRYVVKDGGNGLGFLEATDGSLWACDTLITPAYEEYE